MSSTGVSEPLKVSVRDFVATVTLNRPETRNAISDQDMVEAIVETFSSLDSNPEIHVAILTGTGSAFSSGGNLKRIGQPGELGSGEPVEGRRGYIHGIQKIPLAFAKLELPVIAAVNGPAIGAGCDLACMCDIRIAAKSAVFAESFVKLGLIPGDGGAWLLQRIVGFSKAAEMTLTGAPLSASQALECGLVSQVVDDQDLIATCEKIANMIAANSPDAVRMSKKLLRHVQDGAGLESTLALSAALQAIAHTTSAHRAALAAFVNKR